MNGLGPQEAFKRPHEASKCLQDCFHMSQTTKEGHQRTRTSNLQIWHFEDSDTFDISHATVLAQTDVLRERKMHFTSSPKAPTVLCGPVPHVNANTDL